MPICPRCQRANPAEADYCHFDGSALAAVAHPVAGNQLPTAFVFSTGRHCRTYDEWVDGCMDEWEEARTLLQEGVFRQFLTNIGRLDLARAAEEGENLADRDIGLNHFLKRLPASAAHAARLDLKPRRLWLGTVRVGDTRNETITILNLGRGLLLGTVTVAEGDEWLRLASADAVDEYEQGRLEVVIKTAREQRVQVQVDAALLTATQEYTAKLTIITNGGIVEAPVFVSVEVQPFTEPPFDGVDSPRAMAVRMQAHPRQAAPLLERGDIALWFASNGWVYPVRDATAPGVAAVQQFFEAMGLTRPPLVRLEVPSTDSTVEHPETCSAQIVLHTKLRKWVYAEVASDMPWLRVITPRVCGPQQAAIEFAIDSESMNPDQNYEGTLRIVANSGQKLAHPVRVQVRRRAKSGWRDTWTHCKTGALAGLATRLVLALPADVYARVLTRSWGQLHTNESALGSPGSWLWSLVIDVPAPAESVGNIVSWKLSPLAQEGFVRHFIAATAWIGCAVGLWLMKRRRPRTADTLAAVIAGGMAGLICAPTIACVLVVVDTVGRYAWVLLADTVNPGEFADSAWLWTPAWIAVSALSWGFLGAIFAAALHHGGARSKRLLQVLQQYDQQILRVCGLGRHIRSAS